MNKTIKVALFFLIILPTFGFNQFIAHWDVVIPRLGDMKYSLYLTNIDKTNIEYIGTTSETNYTFSLSVEGEYLLGIKAVEFSGDEVIYEFPVSWSDNPDVCLDNRPFKLRYFEAPSPPTNLTIGSM